MHWSALLLDDHLAKLADEIKLGMIITPSDRLKTVELESPVSEAISKMGTYYDQLPVMSKNKLAGMIFRNDIPVDVSGVQSIKSLCKSSSMLESVHAGQSIKHAIEHLCDNEVCIVFDTSTGEFCGLLHYADLNKQAVRIFCYLWTSALEMSLAELLSVYSRNEDWVDALSEHRQIQVLGRSEFRRRQQIELSPIEGLELSDLINIWSKRTDLSDIFGITKSQFQQKANHLVDLRHASMHPIRTLVKNHSEVKALSIRISDLCWLASKTIDLVRSKKVTEEND